MTKKYLAILLALALLISSAPLAFARPADDGWLIYCTEMNDLTFDLIIVAPAKYTRATNSAKIETICSDAPGETLSLTPEAERIPFYTNGVTEERLTLKVSCAVPDRYSRVTCAVTAGSLKDKNGGTNPYVRFDDETEYMSAGGYAEIDVNSKLLKRDYARDAGTVAVGDTMRVDYSGLYPIEIFVNGESAATMPGGELQRYTKVISATGDLTITVLQNGREISSRTAEVITSEEMYRRNLRDGLITEDDIPGTDDLIESGLPEGSIFIPLAKIIAFFIAVRDFFYRMFSFGRISD